MYIQYNRLSLDLLFYGLQIENGNVLFGKTVNQSEQQNQKMFCTPKFSSVNVMQKRFMFFFAFLTDIFFLYLLIQ